MSFNGSGTFVRSYNWTSDATNGILVRSDRMDGEDNGFATGLSTVICKDGQTTTTAAIPFAVGVKVNDGTVSTPAIAFTSELSSGLFRASASNVALAVSGINTANFSSSNMTAGTHYTVSSATPLYNSGTSTGYFQHSLQNLSSGTTASTDVVCTADTGTDTTNYINFGVNSSGYTGTAPFNLALDGYLFAQSANLNIGTVAANVLNFATNNTVVGAFDASGNFSIVSGNLAINTNKFTVAGSTGNTVVAGTLTIASDVAINTNKFTVTAASGNTVVAGTLAVTGATTLTGGGTSITPTAGDNSTNIATTAYVDRGSSGACMVLLGTATASNYVATTFTGLMTSTYTEYLVVFSNIIPAVNSSLFGLQIGEAGIIKSAANYEWHYNYSSSNNAGGSSGTTTGSNIVLGTTVGSNATNGGMNGEIRIFNPSSTAGYKAISLATDYFDGTNYSSYRGGGHWTGDTGAITDLNFYFAGSNTTSGTFQIYGIRKA